MRLSLAYVLVIAGILVFSYPLLRDTTTIHVQERLLTQWDETYVRDQVPTSVDTDMARPGRKPGTEEKARESGEERGSGEDSREGRERPAFFHLVPFGVLQISSIDVRIPIFDGTDWAELQVGAGLLEETVRPGEEGNSVLTAHRSHSEKLLFRRLDELDVGDSVIVAMAEATHRYTVRETHLVHRDDVTEFTGVRDEAVLTLITCHPLGEANPPYRIVVVAEPEE